MSSPARPAVVRFYVDADVLGLAKVLTQVRNDVTYPADPGSVLHRRQRSPCPIRSPGRQGPDLDTRGHTTWLVDHHPGPSTGPMKPDRSSTQPLALGYGGSDSTKDSGSPAGLEGVLLLAEDAVELAA
jgi:hypothetical protein